MDLFSLSNALIPSWITVGMLLSFLTYLGLVGSILPGKLVPGAVLADGTRLTYRCNGLLSLLLLVVLLGVGGWLNFTSFTMIADRGLELLSTTLIFSILVTVVLYAAGCRSRDKGSSLKPYFTGNFIHDCDSNNFVQLLLCLFLTVILAMAV